MTNRKLPVGVQSFENLRKDNYVYVDKTGYIWNLVERGKSYFLSRPRRFGKSLLVSTMEAYFKGQKELFSGLAIEKLEKSRGENAWTEYPVITFSLSGGEYNEKEGLELRLDRTLQNYENEYDVDDGGFDLSNRFAQLIRKAAEKTGKQVVVLVDEYDKPLLETMVVNEEQEEKNRQLYKGFFSVLKDEDKYLKFVFFTGVTKFSKVSIFSDLNQLKDISLIDDYSGICGITEEEMLENLGPEIREMAEKMKIPDDECIEKLQEMYDGYRFSAEGASVYNPFSLLNAFQDKDLSTYWFETGTPTFLIKMLEKSRFTPEQFTDGVEIGEQALKNYRPESTNPIPLFYQTGYLTLCGFDREFRIYSLRFPNSEVKYGFLNSLTEDVLGSDAADDSISLPQMVRSLRNGNAEDFMTRLEALFASIPYPGVSGSKYENEWRNQMFLIFSLLGQNVQCEVHSAKGRADCVVKTDKYIYVFEFKLDKSADDALKQIEEKGYAEPYKADPRKVIKIGVNFSTEERNVREWKMI